jgi:hypothetical protein
MQALRRIVGADAGLETIVPVVHAADDIAALDAAVRHQRAAVGTTTIEY